MEFFPIMNCVLYLEIPDSYGLLLGFHTSTVSSITNIHVIYVTLPWALHCPFLINFIIMIRNNTFWHLNNPLLGLTSMADMYQMLSGELCMLIDWWHCCFFQHDKTTQTEQLVWEGGERDGHWTGWGRTVSFAKLTRFRVCDFVVATL